VIVSNNNNNVKFNATKNAKVNLKIFDLSGVKVIELSADNSAQNIEWNLKNAKGKAVASGVYLWTIEISDGNSSIRKTGKLAVIK